MDYMSELVESTMQVIKNNRPINERDSVRPDSSDSSEAAIEQIIKRIKASDKSKYGYHVEGNINVSGMNLTSLDFGLKIASITGEFDCSNNKLTSLKGGPIEGVDLDYNCSNNKLENFEFAPALVGGDFMGQNQGTIYDEGDVRMHCDVEGTIFV